MELIVGNIAFSTWSLRPWLVLKRCGADFTLREVSLYGPGSAEAVAAVSPTGKVPVLVVDGETIWDSLSIAVWCAERYPEAGLWPAEDRARWLARSVVCEMHAGFMALRTDCGMGPDHTMVGPDRSDPPTSPEVGADLRRLVTIFTTMRTRFGSAGDYLFGAWSIPDAFFTPVAARIRHYRIDLAAHGDTDGIARAYVETLLSQPEFLEWSALAMGEPAPA